MGNVSAYTGWTYLIQWHLPSNKSELVITSPDNLGIYSTDL